MATAASRGSVAGRPAASTRLAGSEPARQIAACTPRCGERRVRSARHLASVARTEREIRHAVMQASRFVWQAALAAAPTMKTAATASGVAAARASTRPHAARGTTAKGVPTISAAASSTGAASAASAAVRPNVQTRFARPRAAMAPARIRPSSERREQSARRFAAATRAELRSAARSARRLVGPTAPASQVATSVQAAARSRPWQRQSRARPLVGRSASAPAPIRRMR